MSPVACCAAVAGGDESDCMEDQCQFELETDDGSDINGESDASEDNSTYSEDANSDTDGSESGDGRSDAGVLINVLGVVVVRAHGFHGFDGPPPQSYPGSPSGRHRERRIDGSAWLAASQRRSLVSRDDLVITYLLKGTYIGLGLPQWSRIRGKNGEELVQFMDW